MVHRGNRGLRHSCGLVRGLCSVNAHGIGGAGPGRTELSGPQSCFPKLRAGFGTKPKCPTRRGSASAGFCDLRGAKPTRSAIRTGGTPGNRHPPSPAHQRPPRPTSTPHSRRPLLRRKPLHKPPPQPAAAVSTIDGDATTGRQVYRKCQACHSLEPGKNALGPSLAGIVGKKSGEVPNYNYSAAMKAANFVWDAATLDAYLLDPQKLIPQNKMPFPGLKTANERKDVIAYLVAATSPAGAPAVAQRAQPPAAPAPTAGPGRPRCGRPTCPMPATRCVRASPRAGWSISASAAPSTDKSIRFCQPRRDRWYRSS